MKYFKLDGTVYAFESDGSQDHLSAGMVELTADEVVEHLKPATKSAYEQMADLESTRTPRREREARMGVTGSQQWLDDLDSEIEALRP